MQVFIDDHFLLEAFLYLLLSGRTGKAINIIGFDFGGGVSDRYYLSVI